MRPHRRQPTRLRRPWDSPGRNTGVGCHFLLQCMKVKSESEVAQSCPTLCDPMDCSLPGSSVHGIFQARVLEWGAIASSKQSPGLYVNEWVGLCWRRQWHPTPVLLPGKCQGWRKSHRLQSMGSQRVGHNWATSLSLFIFMHWRRKWQPTPVFLPGESQGQGSPVGCRLWGHTESDTTKAT